ncbi:hypothetical protein [Abyssisolibacter fermentans]|uniref:hypothetical protein n=1 Tax=Abyssisolibacter fermentans TaxID=1766203 RepID=UPI001FA7BC0C|nr:hypothetical protein [Abyssisolibacter fermentans]
MFKKLLKFKNIVQNIHNIIEYDIEPYRKILEKIRAIKLESVSDIRLKEMSQELMNRA